MDSRVFTMPIDENFQENLEQTGEHEGIAIWGEQNIPEKYSIYGTNVAVDYDLCVADGACLDACPTEVFVWMDTPGSPASEKKAFPANEEDCIVCRACETVCPVQAILISE